jgi:parallel beta-helix repeat protein
LTLVIYSNITNNIIGIHLESSSAYIQFNNIANNEVGIQIAGSDNRIDHNNFINNTKQVYDIAWDNPEMSPSINEWYEGDTGNYWSDYNGTGDTPYVIDENNQDNEPVNQLLRITNEPWEPHIRDFPSLTVLLSVIIMVLVGLVMLIYFIRVKYGPQNAEGNLTE